MLYWQQGQYLNNRRYLVEQLLGGGGYGVAYKVKDTNSNKLFAIKTLNNQRQQEENFDQLQYKLINEIIALAKCSHRNIVQVYPQVFSENGLLCMVMDYIEGQDLDEYLKTKGKFSEQDAIDIITQVGEAVNYVHNQGFLHRDIKPANILLRKSDSSPVLIDFGLAREYDPRSLRSMTDAKTECFAPIEQYNRNGNFGAWTDVYALAATLYVLMTGELPLPSRYRSYAPLLPPKELNSNISNRVNEAILKGMELEPKDRPLSVQQWLELLQPTAASSFNGKLIIDPKSELEIKPKILEEIKERIDKLRNSNNNLNPYNQLSYLLKNKKWQEADDETIEIILNLTNRERYGSLRSKDIENIPDIDLLKIDLLWLEASNNHFGFTVQRHIWQNQLGLKLAQRQLNNSENIRDFSTCVGWYIDDELHKSRNDYNFSLDAPQGHLPSLRFPCSEFPDMNWWQSWKRIFSSFLIQTEKCLLN